MPEYLPIPSSAAEKIAHDYSKSMVVILAYDPEHALTHTTTFGVSAEDKEAAARCGELATTAMGADLVRKQVFEDFHNDPEGNVAAKYKEAVDLLASVVRRGPNLSVLACRRFLEKHAPERLKPRAIV